MKIPLMYQVSNYDCGPTSLLNVFSYLYDTKDIPAIIIQTIWRYTLDSFGDSEDLGTGGTSKYAMQLFTNWLKEYAKVTDFPIDVNYLEGKKVNYQMLLKAIDNDSVIVIRCYQTCDHYVLITDFIDGYFYIFDPYYIKNDFINKDKMIGFDWEHPFQYNRIVDRKRLFSESKDDFSLGPILDRECIVFSKKI